jgi:uncharacterized protein HemX
MKRLLSIVAMLGLLGLGTNLLAQQQQQQGTQDPTATSPQTQSQTDTSTESARNFEGKIMKSGGKLVLQDSSTQTAYQLDDQSKAMDYQGKNVRVVGTLDQTTNILHVVDITPEESEAR